VNPQTVYEYGLGENPDLHSQPIALPSESAVPAYLAIASDA
jgi:hypothetical protein